MRLKNFAQRGAILILTALALPLFIVGAGLAVDLGDYAYQKGRLQNAADAAAIAGAHAYAENDEKVASHPKADAQATEYVLGAEQNLPSDWEVTEEYEAAKYDDTTTYYRAHLTKEVPLFFLSHFMDDPLVADVDATASIATVAASGGFENLFIFKDRFDAVNSLNNPDKLTNSSYSTDSKNMITTTFDGKVSYTQGDGTDDSSYTYESLTYSTQTSALQYFLTSEAQTANETQNINTILEGDDATFEAGEFVSGYKHQAQYQSYNFSTFESYCDSLTSSGTTTNNQNVSTSNSSLFGSGNTLRVDSPSGNNLNLTVDSSLGDSDEPFYVYVAATEYPLGVVNINLSADTGRPLIICIDGDASKRYTQVHFNLNGYTFKGVVYAPYANEWEGVLVNAGNSTFMGTIVGSSISLRGNSSSYIYKDWTGTGGSGSGTTATHNVTLAAPPSGLSWS